MRASLIRLAAGRRRAAGAAVVAGAVLVATIVGIGGHRDPAPRFRVAAESPPAIDAARAGPAVPASRSMIRSTGPHLVPEPLGKHPECRLTLPSGVWSLDDVAARALTMVTAGAYRAGKPVATAALAFERALHQKHERTVPSQYRVRHLLAHSYRHLPPTWAVDSVLALYSPQNLTCVAPIRKLDRQDMLTNGLTLRAQTMVFAFFAAGLGGNLGGFAPGGVFSGHIENSAHYEGRAVDVSFPTSDPDNNRRGWLLAQWLVAQADYLQIATIIFDDHLWSALHSDQGWRPYAHPSGNTTDPTLRHLDHVHVDVEHGLPAGPPPYVAMMEAKAAGQGIAR
jgi:hypothetical protein